MSKSIRVAVVGAFAVAMAGGSALGAQGGGGGGASECRNEHEIVRYDVSLSAREHHLSVSADPNLPGTQESFFSMELVFKRVKASISTVCTSGVPVRFFHIPPSPSDPNEPRDPADQVLPKADEAGANHRLDDSRVRSNPPPGDAYEKPCGWDLTTQPPARLRSEASLVKVPGSADDFWEGFVLGGIRVPKEGGRERVERYGKPLIEEHQRACRSREIVMFEVFPEHEERHLRFDAPFPLAPSVNVFSVARGRISELFGNLLKGRSAAAEAEWNFTERNASSGNLTVDTRVKLKFRRL